MLIQPIILAAGSSSRMSSPKQLLPFGQSTFIRHIADHLASLSLLPTLCVTGFLQDELHDALNGMSVKFVHHPNHQQGMTSSIRFALAHTPSNCDAVLIVLTDQPLIPQSHFKALVETAQDPNYQIVATAYTDSFGVPALFKSNLFDDLMTLEGEGVRPHGGAKQLISDHLSATCLLTCEEAAKDIDTDDDYQKLIG